MENIKEKINEIDNNVLLLQKMFDKRLKTYKTLKYNIIELYSLGI